MLRATWREPSDRTIRNFRIVASRSSSPEEKTFPRCSLMVRTSTSNSSAIRRCVSQIVSSSYRVSMLESSSCAVKIRNSAVLDPDDDSPAELAGSVPLTCRSNMVLRGGQKKDLCELYLLRAGSDGSCGGGRVVWT